MSHMPVTDHSTPTTSSSTAPSWTITKTAIDNWGNGGAFSSVGIAGNGFLKVTLTTARDWVIGLSTTNADANYDTIHYALNFSSDRFLYLQESGAIVYTSPMNQLSAADGDEFVIRRTGTTITYEHNGATLYTSAVPSTGTLYVDIAMFRRYSIADGIALYNAAGTLVDLTWTGVTGVTIQSVRPSRIETWGDSLTEGPPGGTTAPYPLALAGLVGYAVNNSGISNETSTQIKTRMLASLGRIAAPAIIWAGRNNYIDPTTVKADIAAMVAALGHTHYLVLGIINGDYADEYVGQAKYTTITTLNSDLSTLYGTRFIDIRAHMVSLYNAGIPQDVTDHANDVPPSSLRFDVLHFNDAGCAAVAAKVYTKIAQLTGVG